MGRQRFVEGKPIFPLYWPKCHIRMICFSLNGYHFNSIDKAAPKYGYFKWKFLAVAIENIITKFDANVSENALSLRKKACRMDKLFYYLLAYYSSYFLNTVLKQLKK